jgi:fibronectin-binding autotransporter adhesin
MKTKLTILKLFILVCSAFATTAVFGQTTYTWTGGDGTGTELGAATNWGGTLPSSTTGDTGQWDGIVSGNLSLVYDTITIESGFGSLGIIFALTANQTGSVSIVSSSQNLAIFGLSNNSADASFNLGDTNTQVLNVIWRPGNANSVHGLVNNSASANIIYPNVRFQSGGGVVHVLLFDGSGNWNVTNNLFVANGPGTLIQKNGSGTMFWSGPSIAAALGNGAINSPITINAGTLVLQNNTVLSGSGIGTTGTQNITNNGTFQYDAAAQSQTLSGAISGPGQLKVSNGTLTLSGTNIYSGGTTTGGGTLQVGAGGTSGSVGTGNVTNNSSLIFNRSDNVTFSNVISGTGSVTQNGSGTLTLTRAITYSGGTMISAGTLQVGAGGSLGTGNITNNGALVFSPANNQFININNNISGSGSVSNMGSGVCTLFGSNTYSGDTTISAGELVFEGVKTGAGDITVADNAALDVFDTGTQVTPNTLTLGSGTGCTLDFSLIGNTSTPIISAGTLSSAGTITVNIDNSPPPLTVGQSYPLLTWASGPAPTVHLGVLNLFIGNLSIVGNTLWLNITGTIAGTVYTWRGTADRTNLTTASNWTTNGTTPATTLPSGLTRDTAQFDGVTSSNLVLDYPNPGWPNTGGFTFGVNIVTTTNQTNDVQIISPIAPSPAIGIFGITNNSPHSSLILGNNTINDLRLIARPGTTGIIHPFINNSTVPVIINPNIDWVAGGGVGYVYDLQGTGNWAITNDMTPDNGALGPITFQMDGSGTVFWKAGKAGTYNPNTVFSNMNINSGTVILKSSFPDFNELSNTVISITTTLDYDPVNSDSQTFNGAISGLGLLKVSNGTLMLSGMNIYSGGTTISGGILQVGAGGTSGSVGSGNVTNNSSLVFNRSGSATFSNIISGTGSVAQNGSGTLTLAGANIYTGPTTVSNGTLVVSSVGGNMNVSGGTITPTAVGSVGTLTVASNMNITLGTVLVSLNKVLSPSNSVVSAGGAVTTSGGTLKLLNFGPNLVIGDKFTIFNQAVIGGPSMTIVSPGFTITNNLAMNGSVTVTSIAPSGTGQITATVSGGQLNLSWPVSFVGLHLQVQTNPLIIGLGTNWITIPGTDVGNNYSTILNNSNGSVFFRLAP